VLELFGADAEWFASGGPMIDSSNADGRSDEEIVKSALAQISPKPLPSVTKLHVACCHM